MVSTSNKMSLHMRTGPHDYGPREWGVFFLRLNRRLESLRSISVRVRAGSRPSARNAGTPMEPTDSIAVWSDVTSQGPLTTDRSAVRSAVGHSISVLIGVSEKATCAQTETFKHSGLKRDDAQRCSSALIINRAVD